MALKIPTASEIEAIVKGWLVNQVLTNTGYVAPTVFKKQGISLPRWNYYNSKDTALKQLYYMAGESGYYSQAASGSVAFSSSTAAQTFGINVDFYLPVSFASNVPVPYEVVKALIAAGKVNLLLIRMYTPNGGGPVYAVFSTASFGMAATVVKATSAQIADMDAYYRNVNKIKAEYNSIVASLNYLAAQPVNNATQGTINRLNNQRNNLYEQIRTLDGVNIVTGSKPGVNGVGFIPLAYIVVLAIVGVAGWGISKLITEKEKSKRIADAYNHQQYMAAEQKKLVDDYKAGLISESVFQAAAKNIGIAMETAKKVAEESSKPSKGLLDGLGNAAMWLTIGLIGYKVIGK